MATKAKPKKSKVADKNPTSGAAGGSEEIMTLAYDAELLNSFVLGNATLGELEGIGKSVQYEMADRGFKLLNEGKLDKAEKIFRGLITLDPFDSYFHTVLGSIYQRRDQSDEAIEEYSRALKVNPYNSTALGNRGEIFFRQGRVLEATQDLSAAIESDPDCKEPATARAQVLAMALAKTIQENKEAILESMSKEKKSGKKSDAKAGKKSEKKADGKKSGSKKAAKK